MRERWCLQVNDDDLRDVTDEWANELLRQTPAVVRMVVYRDETPLKEDDIYDIFNLDLMKKPNKGLGISIVSRQQGNGIFISDIVIVSNRRCYLIFVTTF